METDEARLIQELEELARQPVTAIRCSCPTRNRQLNDSTCRLVWSLSPETTLLIGGPFGRPEVITLHQNEVAAGYPGAPTNFGGQYDCRTFALVFTPDYIRLVTYNFQADNHFSSEFCNIRHQLPPHGYALFNLLRQFKGEQEHRAAAACLQSLLELTLSELQKSSSGKQISKSQFTWNRIDNYLQSGLKFDLSRSAVAREFQLNPCYLSSLCLTQTGKKFNEYVRSLRLNQAALLLELDLSLDEIAMECGFSYTSYMIRSFRKIYGMSPGQYRENCCGK